MHEPMPRLVSLMKVFHRMQSSCMWNEMEKEGLGDLRNPEMLFILDHHFPATGASQREIADFMGVAPPTVAISVKRLEKAGYINKISDKKDQRVNRITLTDQGRAYTQGCERAAKTVYHRVIEGFTQEEIDCVCGYYVRMIRNMKEMDVRSPANLDKRVML